MKLLCVSTEGSPRFTPLKTYDLERISPYRGELRCDGGAPIDIWIGESGREQLGTFHSVVAGMYTIEFRMIEL